VACRNESQFRFGYFEPQSLSWQILGRESDVKTDPVTLGYPRVHLLPNGRVFRATPAAPPDSMASFNVEINPIRGESLADRNDISVRVRQAPEEGYGTGDNADTSVLLPLTPAISGEPGSADRGRYRARILLAGGRN
jgi:hypothetical protein